MIARPSRHRFERRFHNPTRHNVSGLVGLIQPVLARPTQLETTESSEARKMRTAGGEGGAKWWDVKVESVADLDTP